MKTFSYQREGQRESYSFSGENLVDAIEKSFKNIRKGCGNVAGDRLVSVKAEYVQGLFCNETVNGKKPEKLLKCKYVDGKLVEYWEETKGGVLLTITAKGSEAIVGYDDNKKIKEDADKERISYVLIEAAKEDLPEPYEFDIKKGRETN